MAVPKDRQLTTILGGSPLKGVQKIFSVFGGICLFIVFSLSFAEVVQRFIFNFSIPWSPDVIRIAFVYSVFIAMAIGVFRKTHLNVDFLVQLFPQKKRVWFDLFSNVITLVFYAVVLRFSITFAMLNSDQGTPYLLFPMSYVYGIIPLVSVFALIFLFFDTYQLLKINFKKNINANLSAKDGE